MGKDILETKIEVYICPNCIKPLGYIPYIFVKMHRNISSCHKVGILKV
jgi:hypothetical protein